MKNLGRVKGSAAQALPLIVGKDTVYVHTDIKREEGEMEGLYSYNEIQYEKDEYIKLLSERNAALETEVTNAQLALCDVYEMIGQGGTENG